MRSQSIAFWTAVCLLWFCRAPAAVLYVDLNSGDPTPPFDSWVTAAANIQDAVDASSDGDLILVTNGIYQTGGRVVYGSLTNRVVIDKAVTVQSINGPGVTLIEGYQDTNSVVADDAIRCVYLTNNAVLSGFTLTNGATRADGDQNLEQSGGGAWCEDTNALVTNCVLIGNAAYWAGGGANQGTYDQCAFVGNAGGTYSGFGFGGGGANNCVLNNCVLTNNEVGALPAPAIKTAGAPNPKPCSLYFSLAAGRRAAF
jgi:hypothetical protein